METKNYFTASIKISIKTAKKILKNKILFISVIKITHCCKSRNFIVIMEMNVWRYNNKDTKIQFQREQFHFAFVLLSNVKSTRRVPSRIEEEKRAILRGS